MISNDKFRITYLGKELYTSKGDLTDYLNRIPNLFLKKFITE